MGSDKKSHKEKKDRKEKKRKRDKQTSSDSEDSEDERRKKRKAAKLAEKIAKHIEKKQSLATQSAPGTERFIWTKKIEKGLESGMTTRDFGSRAEHERQIERLKEIEKVKEAREKREEEKARMEEELGLLQRERARAEAMESEAKEDEFHLSQAQVRARRRLAEGRAKAIDYVTSSLYMLDVEGGGPEQQEPYRVFDGLSMYEVQELYDDIKFYRQLDRKDPQHVEFWDAMTVVAEHELQEAARRDHVDRTHLLRQQHQRAQGTGGDAAGAGSSSEQQQQQEGGVHKAVEKDIEAMFAGKRYSELEAMESQVAGALDGSLGDPEFWEAALARLKIYKARARLRELQASLLEKHLSGVDVRGAMGWDMEAAGMLPPPPSDGQLPGPPEDGVAVAGEAMEEDDGPDVGPELAALRRRAAAAAQELLRKQRGDTADGPADKDAADAAEMPPPVAAVSQRSRQPQHPDDIEEDELEEEESEEPEDAAAVAAALSDGRFSPRPVTPALVAGQHVVHEEEDAKLLELLRQQVRMQESSSTRAAEALAAAQNAASEADRDYHAMILDRGTRPGVVHPMLRNIADAAPQTGELQFRSGREPVLAEDETTRALRAAASRTMGADEADKPFTGEVTLDANRTYWWHDRYKPRRPKYFNRVHTGYEWNKYNQTHYDSDNPPPKVVQGYKFNVFYPDLIDKSQAPTYKTAPDPASNDGATCLLIFTAGPPYEDIAFRIVAKEWEYSHKKGFRCTFERGILHLYFNFKRTRYRR